MPDEGSDEVVMAAIVAPTVSSDEDSCRKRSRPAQLPWQDACGEPDPRDAPGRRHGIPPAEARHDRRTQGVSLCRNANLTRDEAASRAALVHVGVLRHRPGPHDRTDHLPVHHDRAIQCP